MVFISIIFALLLLSVICFLIFLKKTNILNEARIRSEKIIYEANKKAYEITQKNDIEIEQKKKNLFELEKKILIKENEISLKRENLFNKEDELRKLENKLISDIHNLESVRASLSQKQDYINNYLQQLAKLTNDEARAKIMFDVEKNMDLEINSYKQKRLEMVNREIESEAKNIIALAISRYSRAEATSLMTTNIFLPNDEIKGKLIGKEGRNIKVFEQVLKIDLIIDDTPGMVIVSSFSPLRREIAKITIEKLIEDGRIQPSSIEEYAKKTIEEMKKTIFAYGQEALSILNISNISDQIIELIGSLKFRLSFGQNVYEHSIEVAKLSGMMAAELGLDQTMAKRAGLLHDIGKAVDHEYDGNHVDLGIKLAEKFGEDKIVINAIASHHGKVEPISPISVLVQAADALSASRPGVRDKINENFFQRVEQIESICREFDIVEKAYVLRSGREVRVIVNTQKTSDNDCFKLAREIKEKIENKIAYQGEIKIIVIREFRTVEKTK